MVKRNRWQFDAITALDICYIYAVGGLQFPKIPPKVGRMAPRFSQTNLSALLFASASLWGVYWVPLRYLDSLGVTGVWSVVIFNAAPLIALLPLFILFGRGKVKSWSQVVVISIFTGGGLALYACGLMMSSVVRATLLFYLTPIWSTLIGMYWLGETVDRTRIVAIVIGLGGMVLLLSGAHAGSTPLGLGDVFGFGSGISWALGATALKRWPQVPIFATTTGQFVCTSLIAALIAVVLFRGSIPPTDAITAAIPPAFFVGVFLLFPSIFLIFWIATQLSPGRVGILMMSEVIVAIITATLFLPEENMSAMQWCGGVMIVAACVFEVIPAHRRATSQH